MSSFLFLVPYLFRPKHSSLFMILATETKALGQLHFKYYAEVKENVQPDKCLEVHDPLKGNVLYWLPSLQNIGPWCVC